MNELTLVQALRNVEGALSEVVATLHVHNALQASIRLIKQELSRKTDTAKTDVGGEE